MSDRCQSCQAEILWARTPSGRRIPLDAEPNPDGNVILTGYEDEARTLTKAELPAYRARGWRIWMPHHATCPNADEWRRRERRIRPRRPR